jgi:hypothetical protein
MSRVRSLALGALILAGMSLAQAQGDKPVVIVAPVGSVQVKAGGSKQVSLDFRVQTEFHINSHTPKSELLIPTVLKLSTPEPVTLAEVKYPAGQDMTFPFSPDEKLSVYSGDFSVDTTVKVPANAAAGTYPVKGELRYQACDHSACYPPHSIPVQFQVTVVK